MCDDELTHVRSINLRLVNVIMAVDDGEHFLVELIEELVQHFGEIESAPEQISFEFDEQIAEHVRVLLVEKSIGLLEHVVKHVL